MVAWVTLAKAVAPHITTIVSAALPAFTTRKSDQPEGSAALMQQQIAELQGAVTRNDSHIRELAEQLQTMVLSLEEAAVLAQRRMRLLYIVSGAALVASLSAIILVVAG